ncbi:DNA cytosine methyltransferase [Bacillus stercoris]|nr:DNA cytosine methyltransferase [Bacillus stercoris]
MPQIKRSTTSEVKSKIYAADIFCGAGGLTNGLQKAGIDVRIGVDIDPACHFPYSYNNNAEFLLKSVEDLQVHDIEGVLPKDGIRLLAGCAPCQTFSTYNRKADQSDKRWWLLLEFLRLVKSLSLS